MSAVPVSVVIITYNEEDNIEDCLKSVHGWANEIVVVDDESTDRTREIVQKYTDRIFTRKMDIEGRHRNWAYDQAQNEWILSLDADERVMDELKTEIDQLLPAADQPAYTIPRRNYIGDYWVKHGGQYPSAQLRLFQKAKFRYEEDEVHPRVRVEGNTCGHLKNDIIHYSYKDFAHFLTKLNGQTTLEAKKMLRASKEPKFSRYFRRSIDRFMRTYFRKKGRKDGFIGFMFAYFAGLYQIMSYAKYWEMKQQQKKDAA